MTTPGVPCWFLRLFSVLMSLLAGTAVLWNPFAEGQSESLLPVDGEGAPLIAIVARTDQVRVVRHLGGVTSVPLAPEKICALGFLDELVALGVKPQSFAANWRGEAPDYLREYLTDAVAIPHAYGEWLPSFETIAALQPDLILVVAGNRHTYEQLSRIAPTVILRDMGRILNENTDLNLLKERLQDLGRVLGREDASRAAIASFDQIVQDAREMIRATMRDRTIAFFRTRGKEWRLYGRRGFCGAEALYDALELQAPALIKAEGIDLDPEALVRFDADFMILVADSSFGADQTMNRLSAHPLWRRTTAVRKKHILELTAYRHWILSGLIGKARMIREILACIEKGDDA